MNISVEVTPHQPGEKAEMTYTLGRMPERDAVFTDWIGPVSADRALELLTSVLEDHAAQSQWRIRLAEGRAGSLRMTLDQWNAMQQMS